MENILGIVTIIVGICGIAGFVLSIINANRQAKVEEMHAKERAEEKERHSHGLKMHAQELEIQAQEMTRTERLMFLTDRIFDPYIPKEFKLPFYEEYMYPSKEPLLPPGNKMR